MIYGVKKGKERQKKKYEQRIRTRQCTSKGDILLSTARLCECACLCTRKTYVSICFVFDGLVNRTPLGRARARFRRHSIVTAFAMIYHLCHVRGIVNK